MLLSVEPFDDATEGTLLDLWFIGGSHKTVRPPCQPHFYTWDEVIDGCDPVQKRLLGDSVGVLQDIYRVEFESMSALKSARYRHFDSVIDYKRYEDQLICEHGFAVPSALPKVLAWDIETFTANRVGVDWRRDTIKSIAVWGVLDEVPSCVMFGNRSACAGCIFDDGGACMFELDADGEPTGFFGRCWKVSAQADEVEVIQKSNKFVNWYDPDVYAGYNDGGYDFRVLLTRCDLLRVAYPFGRDGSPPYIVVSNYKRRGKEREICRVRIHGRVHFDVMLEVFLDQTLYDLKGRGQFEVAKHFGFNPTDDVDHANIPDDRVEDVNLDDARCCFGLAQLYLLNIYALCEELAVPLNLMVDRSPSHIPNWFYGQAFSKLGIVSDNPNHKRFPEIFGRGGKPYQGALTRCFRRGIFFNVKHRDFSGFYPSIMIEYNLSPENVTLVAIKPYTGEVRIDKYDDYWIIEVPDVPKLKGKPNWKTAAQIVCRVDMTKDSVTKKKLLEIRKARFDLKKEYKRTKDMRVYSRQYAKKVIQNTVYGYNGMFWSLYGNVLVALLVTALGRYHMAAELRKPEYGETVVIDDLFVGDKIIECDTDGFYHT